MAKYIRAVEAAEKVAGTFKVLMADLVDIFAEIPTADVAPVVYGRWVTHYRSGTPVAEGYVSTCCDMWNKHKRPYCPNCGAKMDEGDNDAAD
jgi:hypothetical protein